MKDNIKILVVDDEEDILEFLSYNLRAEGYDVIVADNGVLAIELAKQQQPYQIVNNNKWAPCILLFTECICV